MYILKVLWDFHCKKIKQKKRLVRNKSQVL